MEHGGSEVDGHPPLSTKFKASLVSEERGGGEKEVGGLCYARQQTTELMTSSQEAGSEAGFKCGLSLGFPRVSAELEHSA